MNNRGMIITSLLYAILAIFILLLFFIVLSANVKKTLNDGIAKKIEEQLDYIPPKIYGDVNLYTFTGQTFAAANYSAGLTAIDDVDGDVTSTITCNMPASPTIQCTARDKSGNVSAVFTRIHRPSTSNLTYQCTGDYQMFTSASTATYKIFLWGAQGGSNGYAIGGRGSYTVGDLRLNSGDKIYIYVGCSTNGVTGGFNGGGTAANSNNSGGGGATDVRLIPGAFNNLESLRSRIMVAAGGGGASYYSTTAFATGGAGGIFSGIDGLKAGTGAYTFATGGTQTSGGLGGNSAVTANGSFGLGGNAITNGAGGGGGYYGGGGGSINGTTVGSGAGGSSFISGYAGTNAINKDGIHTGASIHYSGLSFSNTFIHTGNDATVPNYNGVGTQTGNSYGGYAKIQFVSN